VFNASSVWPLLSSCCALLRRRTSSASESEVCAGECALVARAGGPPPPRGEGGGKPLSPPGDVRATSAGALVATDEDASDGGACGGVPRQSRAPKMSAVPTASVERPP